MGRNFGWNGMFWMCWNRPWRLPCAVPLGLCSRFYGPSGTWTSSERASGLQSLEMIQDWFLMVSAACWTFKPWVWPSDLCTNKRCTKDHQSIFAYYAADKFESFRTYVGFRLIRPNQQEVLVKDQQHNASGQPLPGHCTIWCDLRHAKMFGQSSCHIPGMANECQSWW